MQNNISVSIFPTEIKVVKIHSARTKPQETSNEKEDSKTDNLKQI